MNLESCPSCNGDAGMVIHEGNWCVYVECGDCGSHTAFFQYRTKAEKAEAEQKAIQLWNMGKVVHHNPGE